MMNSQSHTLDLPREALAAGMDLIDLLVAAGLAATATDARRLVRSAQARLNGRVIPHEGVTANLNDLNSFGFLELSAADRANCRVRAA